MGPADLVFVNGQVVTVDPRDRVVSAVAVKGDRIVYVGDDAGAREWRGPATRVIDLRGRTVTPGLIDAHCHLVLEGGMRDTLNLKWPAVKSIADIQRLVAEAARSQPPGTWIRGRGYNHHRLAERRHPTRDDLDAVAPHHPVVLTRTCGHIVAANSLALERGGWTDASEDPPGGQLDRDEHGRLNGVCRETARDPVRQAAAFSREELREHYRYACEAYVRQGVTSAHDMGRPVTTPELMAWHRDDDIALRVFAFVLDTAPFHADKGLLPDEGGPLRFLAGDDRFRVGHYKLFADGSSSGPTAGTREPYAKDPENFGLLTFTQEEIDERYLRANRMGWPTSAHAVGDRGIAMVLNAQQRAMEDRPRNGVPLSPAYGRNPRHRIEHCAMAYPDLRERIRRMGVIPVAQPVFLYEFGDGYVEDYGFERGSKMMPCKTFLREGIPVVGSSDAPVTSGNVLLGLSITCTRRTQSGQVLAPEERLTPLEAIRIYTLHGAYAEFQEDVKGSVEVGKFADLTVFSGPLLDIDPEEWTDLSVDFTVIGGRVVFEREGADG